LLKVSAFISISAKKLPQASQILVVLFASSVSVLSLETSNGLVHSIEANLFARSRVPAPLTIPV